MSSCSRKSIGCGMASLFEDADEIRRNHTSWLKFCQKVWGRPCPAGMVRNGGPTSIRFWGGARSFLTPLARLGRRFVLDGWWCRLFLGQFVEFVELGLEQLLVGQSGLVLSNKSGRHSPA